MYHHWEEHKTISHCLIPIDPGVYVKFYIYIISEKMWNINVYLNIVNKTFYVREQKKT